MAVERESSRVNLNQAEAVSPPRELGVGTVRAGPVLAIADPLGGAGIVLLSAEEVSVLHALSELTDESSLH